MSVFLRPGRLEVLLEELEYGKVLSEYRSLTTHSINDPIIPPLIPNSFSQALILEATHRSRDKLLENYPTDSDIEWLKERYARLQSGRAFSTIGRGTPMLDYKGYVTIRGEASESLQRYLTTKLFLDLCTNTLHQCPFESLVQYVQTLTDYAKYYIDLLEFDEGRVGFISEQGLIESVKRWAQNLSFVSKRSEPNFFERYALYVSHRLLLVLDPLRAGRISLNLLLNDPITMNWILLPHCPEDRVNVFNETIPVSYCQEFDRIDSGTNGFLTPDDLCHLQSVRFIKGFTTRVCEILGSDGVLNFEGFVRFRIAWDNIGSAWANTTLFDLIDVDGDGCITRNDLNYFYKEVKQRTKILYPKYDLRPIEVLVSANFDLCQASGGFATKKQIIDLRNAAEFFHPMVDVKAYVYSELGLPLPEE